MFKWVAAAAAVYMEKALKGPFPYARQRRAAAATATHLNIYGSNPVIIIPYIVMYVAAAAAARRCRVYGKGP